VGPILRAHRPLGLPCRTNGEGVSELEGSTIVVVESPEPFRLFSQLFHELSTQSALHQPTNLWKSRHDFRHLRVDELLAESASVEIFGVLLDHRLELGDDVLELVEELTREVSFI